MIPADWRLDIGDDVLAPRTEAHALAELGYTTDQITALLYRRATLHTRRTRP